MNKSRWLTLALLISLGFNLLVVGLVVGRVLADRDRPELRPFPASLGWMFRDLNEDTRRSLRSAFENHVARAVPMRRDMARAQRAFYQLLEKEQFDTDAVSDSLAELRRTSDDYQTEMHSMMVAVLNELDPHERKKVSRQLMRFSRGSPGPRDRSRRDGAGLNRPGRDRPGRDRPGHDRPGHDRPGHDRPGHERQGTEQPGFSSPEPQPPTKVHQDPSKPLESEVPEPPE